MEAVHALLHDFMAWAGTKQCTNQQLMGICLEFWAGIAAIKIPQIIRSKRKPQ